MTGQWDGLYMQPIVPIPDSLIYFFSFKFMLISLTKTLIWMSPWTTPQVTAPCLPPKQPTTTISGFHCQWPKGCILQAPSGMSQEQDAPRI